MLPILLGRSTLMDYALINRHNIVDRFFKNTSLLSLSKESTDDVMIFEVPEFLEIRRYPKENKYTFSMLIKGTFEEEEYDHNYSHFNPVSSRLMVKKTRSNLVEVMRYTDGNFKMVSTASDSKWIEFARRAIMVPGGGGHVKEELISTLDMEYSKLPLTEESHFQRMTTNEGLILELEYCLKVQQIIEFIDSIGSIIAVDSNNNLTIPLLFTERLSEGG